MKRHILIEARTQYTTLTPLVKACQALGVPYSIFSYFRETEELIGIPETDKEFFTFSTTGPLLSFLHNTPLTFLNDYNEPFNSTELRDKFYRSFSYSDDSRGFDQETAIANNVPMVNADAKIIPMSEARRMCFKSPVFIKPSDDLKTFTATVTEPNERIEDAVMRVKYMPHWESCSVVIASVKNIASEYRLFVYDNKIVSGSRYFENGQVSPDPHIPDNVLSFGAQMIGLFSPARAYTLDIGVMMDGSMKVVEYNCFNISGIYRSDARMIIGAVSGVWET